jgi:hypothetical protein
MLVAKDRQDGCNELALVLSADASEEAAGGELF